MDLINDYGGMQKDVQDKNYFLEFIKCILKIIKCSK